MNSMLYHPFQNFYVMAQFFCSSQCQLLDRPQIQLAVSLHHWRKYEIILNLVMAPEQLSKYPTEIQLLSIWEVSLLTV